MSILKKDVKVKKEVYDDIYYKKFHGFDRLEREFRADGWFHGRASDYAACKEKLIRERPRNCLVNPLSSCYFSAPFYTVNMLSDSVTIVHGPVGCGSILYLCAALYKTSKVICTQMNQNDAIMGSETKLRKAIKEARDRYNPGVIAVLGTCTSAIIGEDLDGICQDMEAELGIPILSFNVSGFKHRNWNIGFDESFNKIIDRMEKKKTIKGTLNFLNFAVLSFHWKEVAEVLPYLTQLGIRVNAHIPCFTTFQEMLDKFPRAELNVVRCPSVGFQTAEYAEKVLDIPYARIPKPLSLKYTEDFIKTIAEFFGCEDQAEDLILQEMKKIEARLEKIRSSLNGKRIAITAGPGKNIGLAQLAVELGMEVVYLSPYKTDTTYHELLQDFLDSTGQDPELMAEPSIYEVEAIMSRLRPDIFLGLMEERAPISRLGIPTVDMEAICTPQLCGFAGAVIFGEYLVDVVESRLIQDWGRYIYRNFPLYSSEKFLTDLPPALKSCQKGKPSTY